MRYLKKYKLFENLESEINLELLEDILIDFIQMDLDYDIKVGSSSVLDFNKLNKERESGEISSSNISIHSADIDLYRKEVTNKSLTIDLFKESKISEFNLDDFKDAYDMVSDFLFNEYNLIPNYIYVNHHWKYQYYENFEMLKLDEVGGKLGTDKDSGWFKGGLDDGESTFNRKYFKAHKVILGFYRK
jgi:hypothetical protein